MAKKLIEKLIEDASYMNLNYIELNSTKEGYELYNKLGFKEIKTNYVPMKYDFNNK
ncbi:GNAT family N-acetyltransferase [Anaerofustis stercorihominis]|uniref:GNAT family N-acetyltransferase n=1 Tax=Anaerofustis stercorihominis TaxID=214853 RepID=A0A3E3DY40_9FIRM|nr:GNAT family N-acetyltransferase [Anaerofustis stercorihominis]RGD73879.1 GNAT family N-acetyltransferase [Anaerofustis stercorihominis]